MQIIDQYLSYLILKRSLKNSCTKRLSNFVDNNNLVYWLQFGFRPKYPTAHALINFTEKVRKALDEACFGFGIFADLQKTFGTAENKILQHKLEYYGIRGVCND